MLFARPDEPLTMDPFIPADNGSIWAIEQVCDTLVEADATGEGVVPGLAESWSVSEDELAYTFKLRDAKFSNGEPVTVEDVVFSYQTAARPDGTYGFLFGPVASIEEDPFIPADNGSIWAIEQVCDTLVEADATGEGVVPGLAESWSVSEDELAYTFKLRDAKFSNGEPVTVEDVVFSYQTAARPDGTYGFLFGPVASIEAV